MPLELTKGQQDILAAPGHLLVKGGPGSGKTTVSILKAGRIAASLRAGQRVLFLSFARATVARVLEAIAEETTLTREERNAIEVDTFHSQFWSLLKTHGYLMGWPRRLSVLAPPSQAAAVAEISSEYKALSGLTDAEKAERSARIEAELLRLAREEGRVCFDLFAASVADLLEVSAKLRALVASKYPVIVLDEFQDTSADQWRVVKALGDRCTLIALADPEQRIFEFIGADPERLRALQSTRLRRPSPSSGPTTTAARAPTFCCSRTRLCSPGSASPSMPASRSDSFPSNENQADAVRWSAQVLQAARAADRNDARLVAGHPRSH